MIFGLILSLLVAQQQFRPDDPIAQDNDTAVDVKAIARFPLNDHSDFLINTLSRPGDRSGLEAVNVNTLGGVPDSAWFQNRHGSVSMAVEALARGPNTGGGPSMAGPWRVIAAKNEGVMPGFRIRDVLGNVYFIKFDPVGQPELATAAEVIATKFFYAIGYHVPENYLASFKKERLQIDAAAKITDLHGRDRRMTQKDLDNVLKRVRPDAAGRYRVVASKLLEGKPVGPFQYFGTRPDDPNDIYPHESRRELRGLRVFCAWLNHNDSKALNSLDMVVGDASKYVKHYLIDFGSTLGSDGTEAKTARAGWEYYWQPKSTLGRVATLGLWDRPGVRAKYPQHSSVGRFESRLFDPIAWKPSYPNPAFDNMTDEDAYWAARIVMSFTDADIMAMVRTGELSDPAAEAYLAHTLMERRDKIGRAWLTRMNSADRFELTSQGELTFDHLASLFNLGPRPAFDLNWFSFGGGTSDRTPIENFDPGQHEGYSLAVISSPEGRVFVYVRTVAGRAEIVGIERENRRAYAR